MRRCHGTTALGTLYRCQLRRPKSQSHGNVISSGDATRSRPSSQSNWSSISAVCHARSSFRPFVRHGRHCCGSLPLHFQEAVSISRARATGAFFSYNRGAQTLDTRTFVTSRGVYIEEDSPAKAQLEIWCGMLSRNHGRGAMKGLQALVDFAIPKLRSLLRFFAKSFFQFAIER